MNTVEYAKVFMSALDKQMVEGATSGWMEQNAGQVMYSGGNEVKIPKVSLNGLGNYKREDGFVKGSVAFAYQTKSLTQDRGRSFQLDAMDVDETNFGMAAGNVLGEFQRTKVIPEVDAYRYSQIASQAVEKQRCTEFDLKKGNILTALLNDLYHIQDVTGDGAEIVITMSVQASSLLKGEQKDRWVFESSEFQQGNVMLKVKSLDGCPVITVPSARMKTAYQFLDGETGGQEAGGFQAQPGAKDINWILTVRQAPIAVSKTDVTRIFDPLTNQKANAWKIDYRKYHDLWIPEQSWDGIWVNTSSAAGA